MSQRLALSMRVVNASGYHEPRDALAQDWGRFLHLALPHAAWMAVPNIGPGISTVLEGFGVDGLILTGGEDWGTSPERDTTEEAALRWAISQRVPVFGVCRGAQVINQFLGGTLFRRDDSLHVATRHPVRLTDGSVMEVNSYHHQIIPPDGLALDLCPAAYDQDGAVEAFTHAVLPVAGIIWHPEREQNAADHDLTLFRRYFAKGN